LAAYADVIRLASASKNASLDHLEMHGQATPEQVQAATKAALDFDEACTAADLLASKPMRDAMEDLHDAVMAVNGAVKDPTVLDALGDDPLTVLSEAVRDSHRKFRETARARFGVK
jgi:hypothetical protein